MTLLAAMTGCAPAYHAYPCGGVPYGYCFEPPLPYTGYGGCPTPCAATLYGERPVVQAETVGAQPNSPDAGQAD